MRATGGPAGAPAHGSRDEVARMTRLDNVSKPLLDFVELKLYKDGYLAALPNPG
jgi:hypothetical protein